MAESTDNSALDKELLDEHVKGYRGFLGVTARSIFVVVLVLILMAIFLV